MAWLLPFNLAWLIWLCLRTGQGISLYEGVHAHVYAWLFMAGLMAWMIGSLLLKWIWYRRQVTSATYTAFGLWLVGFLFLGFSLILGASVPEVHILKQHVLFGHVNYLEFLIGLILSAYLDFRIIAKYAPFKQVKLWRDDIQEESDGPKG